MADRKKLEKRGGDDDKGAGVFDLGGLTVSQLAKRTWSEMNDDGVWDAGAQLAYYFMLALFPLIIFLISLLATAHATNVVGNFMATLQSLMPGQAFGLIGGEVERIMSSPSGGLLTFGALGTLWAASSGVASLLQTLDTAYDVAETRSWLKLRAIALGLTLAFAVLIISGAVLLMTGDKISAFFAAKTGQAWMGTVGTWINYALGLAFMFLGLEVAYYFGPNVKDQKWAWVSPGSLVGVVLFVLSSVGFSLYLRFNDTYSATYGSLGAVIVLLLWLYLLGIAVVAGGEVNAEIAHAAAGKGNVEAPAAPPMTTTDVLGGVAIPERPALLDARPSADADGNVDVGRVVETAVGDLFEALKSQNGQVRASAAVALRNSAPDNLAVVMALTQAVEDSHPEVRKQAIASLERFGTNGIGGLVNALSHPDRETRRMAAVALGNIGPSAKAALPALNELAREASVYEAALDAFTKIDRVEEAA